MSPSEIDALRTRIEALPHAHAIYPQTLSGKLGRFFWTAYTPVHPYVRDIALMLRLVNQKQFLDDKGRQRYLIGTVAPHMSIEEFVRLVVSKGYGNNFVAWHDDGEVASLRLPMDLEHQYHMRIFSDREVRGHYELTPEAHPLKHYREEGLVEHRDYFRSLLGEAVSYAS